MLLKFIVENYLSFKDRAVLDMQVSVQKESKMHVHTQNKYSAIKSVAIYGANASGKSNFLHALHFMKAGVLSSADIFKEQRIGVYNFRLNSESEKLPSIFEVSFLVKNYEYENIRRDVVFRYGFEIDREKVHKEWLFARFTAQESKLFMRDGDIIDNGEKFVEGKQVYKAIGKIRRRTLFLSQIITLKGENAPISNTIAEWFSGTYFDSDIKNLTLQFMERSQNNRDLVLKALNLVDVNIDNILIEEKDVDLNKIPEEFKLLLNQENKNPRDFKFIDVKTYHKKYDCNGKLLDEQVFFDFDAEESEGTKKFFTIIGPILQVLKSGGIFVLDELDSEFHPNLSTLIINLFNSNVNSNGAQLIFSAHNTLFMNALKKEQIYFTEKNGRGESEFYVLEDFKVRNKGVDYSKNYLLGKYGANPFLGNLEALIEEVDNGE